MITYAQAERLLDIHAADRSVLSLYVGIPRDPAQLRELPARAHDLIRLAAADLDGYRGQAAGLAEDERRVSRLLEVHGREWLGHTAALFAAAGTGQAEAFALPCQLPDRAILATRPHIRPLLVTLQRCPAHYVVVVDQRRAWLFRVTGDEIETTAAAEIEATAATAQAAEGGQVAGEAVSGEGPAGEGTGKEGAPPGEGAAGAAGARSWPGAGAGGLGAGEAPREPVRSRRFGGWYGLESYRINERVIELAHSHLHATVTLLERAMRPGWPEPLVLGGHAETVSRFAKMLPTGLRDKVAGTFVVDPHTMTPARVRDLARPVIANWVREREDRLVGELRAGQLPGAAPPLTVTGLPGCLAAVNARAVALLVVPAGGVLGGYACERCGTLSATGADCSCPDGRPRWVPDLLEEMVVRTISEGGTVEAVADPPGEVAARLRFPVSGGR